MSGIIGLIRRLPEGYEEACFETGAITRKRGISDPNDLMYLCMMHMLYGCSLLEVAAIARMNKMGEFSDVAFMKRFSKCVGWFQWICEHILPKEVIEYGMPEWLSGYRVLAVDATDVQEKGRSQRIYRLHLALDIFKARVAEHRITTNKTGETLRNFEFKPGDLVIADRAYSSINGIAYCLDKGARVIARVRSCGATLYDHCGNKVDILSTMQRLGSGEVKGYLKDKDRKLDVRICFKRKTEEQIQESEKRVKRVADRKKKNLQQSTLDFNGFIVLMTNLPDSVSYEAILDLYRLRWQVEMYFKRLKSILSYGELPKKTEQSSLAWINGKIMLALLLERFMADSFFPPEAESESQFMA